MMASKTLTRARLKTPSAAAIAGLLFAILLTIAFWLIRISVPADPQEPGAWLRTNSSNVVLAVNLVPFAGIAFLWFIGVLRDLVLERVSYTVRVTVLRLVARHSDFDRLGPGSE